MTKKLSPQDIEARRIDVPGWRVEQGRLVRDWEFPDFKAALAFVNRVAAVAEARNHHPEIDFGFGRCRLTVFSHDVDGLSERDFDLAAAIDGVVFG